MAIGEARGACISRPRDVPGVVLRVTDRSRNADGVRVLYGRLDRAGPMGRGGAWRIAGRDPQVAASDLRQQMGRAGRPAGAGADKLVT